MQKSNHQEVIKRMDSIIERLKVHLENRQKELEALHNGE